MQKGMTFAAALRAITVTPVSGIALGSAQPRSQAHDQVLLTKELTLRTRPDGKQWPLLETMSFKSAPLIWVSQNTLKIKRLFCPET